LQRRSERCCSWHCSDWSLRPSWRRASRCCCHAVVTLGILFGAGVFPVNSTTLVPLAGLMIGNSMTATVLVTRRVTAEFRDKRLEIEARL